MGVPGFIQIQKDGVRLAIKVQPRAGKNEIRGALGNELKVTVTAPPLDSAANEALLRFLAEKFDCPRSVVQLVRGHTSRHKTVFVHGFSAADVLLKLGVTQR